MLKPIFLAPWVIPKLTKLPTIALTKSSTIKLKPMTAMTKINGF